MKKTLLTEKNALYLERMQKPLGHHSWWYTNRSSEDCINVKIHAWVNDDKVLALLTKKEQKAIEVLGIKIDEVIERTIWGDYGIIEQAREDLKESIDTYVPSKEHRIEGIEYGGRSGGWMCIEYRFGGLVDEFINETELDAKEKKQAEKDVASALQYIEDTTQYVLKAKKELKKYIEDPQTYIEEVREAIANEIEHHRAMIERNAQRLADLAEID